MVEKITVQEFAEFTGIVDAFLGWKNVNARKPTPFKSDKDRIKELEKQNKKLRAALEPFNREVYDGVFKDRKKWNMGISVKGPQDIYLFGLLASDFVKVQKVCKEVDA